MNMQHFNVEASPGDTESNYFAVCLRNVSYFIFSYVSCVKSLLAKEVKLSDSGNKSTVSPFEM